MRCIALFTMAVFGMLHSSFALVDARERTTVDVWANAWDTRTSGAGCSPSGCRPELTRDQSQGSQSRWSCNYDLEGETCEICYEFDEPQDIVYVCFALWLGNTRVRRMGMTFYDSDDDTSSTTFTSSGTTSGFECMWVDTDETEKACMKAEDLDDDEWLSILETEFRVE